jgi:hypothetical protein
MATTQTSDQTTQRRTRARGEGPSPEGSSPRASRRTNANANAEDRRYMERSGVSVSRSLQRARWIHSPDEHEERPGQTLATRSPEVIRAWAEQRGAIPATVGKDSDSDPRVLRFDFPGFGGRNLRHIDWDAWLRVFQDRNLVFIFQEHKRDGTLSNFFRLENPERQDG